ncbi:hypothetical protein F4801DRAFT_571060 [Xylaria longipes]|nr:hypothetical protein F4801DRAFT_571060 [Xylaria longipes]RYC54990.1 hypothetical protein CHU98_g11228 [Xylaria longipes]
MDLCTTPAVRAIFLFLLLTGLSVAGDKHPEVRLQVSGSFKSSLPVLLENLNENATAWAPTSPHSRVKRAGPIPNDPTPGEQDVGLAFNIPGCIVCPSADPQDGQALLESLTWQYMQARMKGTDSDYKDTCVFYTRADTPGARLSGLATQWACSVRKYTIWHFWPNAIDAKNGPAGARDFYAMDDPNSWLAPIRNLEPPYGDDKPAYIFYFEAMSMAMAERCTGEITIMTPMPADMAAYSSPPITNIWGNVELPSLIKRRQHITRTVVVDSNSKRIWELDLLTLQVGKELMVGDLAGHSKRSLEINGDALDKRADLCGSSVALDSEPAGRDWFAGDYSWY